MFENEISFPEKIRQLMRTKMMNTAGLSKKTGISQSVLSRILKGETSTPQMKTVTKIALALDVTPESLLDGTEVRLAKDVYKVTEAPIEKESIEQLIPFYDPCDLNRTEVIEWQYMMNGNPHPSITQSFVACPKIMGCDRGTLFATRVADDATAPVLSYGALVFISISSESSRYRVGDFVLAFEEGGDFPVIRKLSLGSDRSLQLTAINPNFIGEMSAPCSKIIGKVVAEFKILPQNHIYF